MSRHGTDDGLYSRMGRLDAVGHLEVAGMSDASLDAVGHSQLLSMLALSLGLRRLVRGLAISSTGLIT